MQAVASRRSALSGARVLLVEDDPGTARALTSVLRSMSCEVVHAARISDARRLAREVEIDLALLDIELPDGSGLDFVLNLRGGSHPCAALVLTGSRQNRHLQEAVGLGVTEYLLKPVDSQTLAKALHRGIEQTLQMRRWLEQMPSAALSSNPRPPKGLGKSPVDLVHRLALEFDLTEREAEALTLVAQGHRDGDIAKHLGVSYSRVRQLLGRGFRKLGLRSRNDFIRFLCERGAE